MVFGISDPIINRIDVVEVLLTAAGNPFDGITLLVNVHHLQNHG